MSSWLAIRQSPLQSEISRSLRKLSATKNTFSGIFLKVESSLPPEISTRYFPTSYVDLYAIWHGFVLMSVLVPRTRQVTSGVQMLAHPAVHLRGTHVSSLVVYLMLLCTLLVSFYNWDALASYALCSLIIVSPLVVIGRQSINRMFALYFVRGAFLCLYVTPDRTD